MKITSQSKLARVVLYILLILVVIALLFLPFGLQFLTLPEQVFVLTLLVFFIMYSKVFGGYYFVSVLLSLIDKWEDVYNHLSKKLTKKSLYEYLLEGDLLILTETQLVKVQEIASLLFDITLVFLLGIGIVFLGGILDPSVFYAVALAVMIVWILAIFTELYVDLKFARVFEEEITQLAEAMFAMNMQNQLEEYKEKQDTEEDNKENSKEENKDK